ncbi:hypothetical protein E8F20_02245 [Pseudomonas sp. BN415]|nr:hypothetical protein [Pseudomonas sp. BN415]
MALRAITKRSQEVEMAAGNKVVVVGAGPTGLLIALGLAQAGAEVTVIDKGEGVLRSPRAMVYLPSTLKVLDDVGVLEDAKRIGAFGYRFTQHFLLSGQKGGLDFHDLEGITPYSYILHFGQDELADLLLERLKALPNAAIQWATAFQGYTQSDDKVQLQLERDGCEEFLDADWLIGCDGAGSAVRKAMGVQFEGFTWDEVFMATNLIYDFEKFDYADNNMVADPDDWRVVAKINNDGLWRVAYGESTELTEEQRVARITERFKRILPDPSEPYELVLANSYRVHQRSAETYRSGRVLLAGDAAHATNPIGGLGLTSGVQDASLLIKSLSAQFNNQAADDALDWYAYERRRCFVEIASPTAIELKRRMQEREPAKRQADEAGFFAMLGNSEYKRKAMLSTFDLAGRPYREDWRQSYVAEDLRNNGGIVSGHGGVTIERAG